MAFSTQHELVLDMSLDETNEYAILKAHSIDCRLSKLDKLALTEYLKHADHVGTGVYLALSRLLRRKLNYASEITAADQSCSIATGGSRITFAIDKLRAQNGRLLSREFYKPGQDDINMASLLGATITGMKAGETAPFLQGDGTFRKVHLISVDYEADQPEMDK